MFLFYGPSPRKISGKSPCPLSCWVCRLLLSAEVGEIIGGFVESPLASPTEVLERPVCRACIEFAAKMDNGIVGLLERASPMDPVRAYELGEAVKGAQFVCAGDPFPCGPLVNFEYVGRGEDASVFMRQVIAMAIAEDNKDPRDYGLRVNDDGSLYDCSSCTMEEVPPERYLQFGGELKPYLITIVPPLDRAPKHGHFCGICTSSIYNWRSGQKRFGTIMYSWQWTPSGKDHLKNLGKAPPLPEAFTTCPICAGCVEAFAAKDPVIAIRNRAYAAMRGDVNHKLNDSHPAEAAWLARHMGEIHVHSVDGNRLRFVFRKIGQDTETPNAISEEITAMAVSLGWIEGARG